MKKRLFCYIIIIVIISSSCSKSLFYPVAEPDEMGESMIPKTKTGTPTKKLGYYQQLHLAQSSHITILIRSIACKDGYYYQLLTDEDMDNLGITKEEKTFIVDYIDSLNKSRK